MKPLLQRMGLMECSCVAVDSEDRVYVLTRNTDNLAIVFGCDHSFLRAFGQGVPGRWAHVAWVGSNGSLYCADDDGHFIANFVPEGKLLMTLGTPGKPSRKWSGRPFNRPTQGAQERAQFGHPPLSGLPVLLVARVSARQAPSVVPKER